MKSDWVRRLVLSFLVSWVASLPAVAGELRESIQIPIIHTETQTYTNVSVLSRSGTDIHIRHDGGVGNVQLDELDAQTRRALGLEGGEAGQDSPEDSRESALGTNAITQIDVDFGRLLGGAGVTGAVLAVFAALALAFYLLGCYLWRRVCLNAGHDPGFLIWLPLLQVIPLFRAAGMSPWWILGLLIPILNLVVGVLWCFKIVAACGKGILWAIFLLLPVLNLIAILYLAFSGSGEARPAAQSQRM